MPIVGLGPFASDPEIRFGAGRRLRAARDLAARQPAATAESTY
jgi:hypothetical protein